MTGPRRRATATGLSQSLAAMVKVRVEWQDEENPWEQHASYWPTTVRAPVVGDYICLSEGSDCRKVTAVLWSLDGSAVIRLEFHPR